MNITVCSLLLRWMTSVALFVSLCLPAGAQVVFDASDQLFADQDATLTIPAFPVGAGDDRLLVVHFLGSNFPTAVTFDGNNMDIHVANQFWYLVLGNGAGITGDISITFPDTTTGSLVAFSCLGVSQSDPLGSVFSSTSFSGTNTLIIPSAVGDLVVDIISSTNYGFGCMMPDFTVGAGQIQKVNEVASLNGLGGVCTGVGLSVEEGAASVEMSWEIINGGSGDYFSFNVQQVEVVLPENVGIGTTSPHPSAKLDVESTYQGVLVPRLDSTQRMAIASPATGLVLYDTDTDDFYFYNGSSWTKLVSGSSDDADADPANELQILSISNDTLFLSDGGFAKLSSATLQDLDGDTKIQVEESADEDIIRFDIGGTEFGSMNGKTFSLAAPGSSLFIGDGAGVQDDSTDNVNTFIGIGAGSYTTSGEGNTFLGFQAGQSNIIGSLNTIIGTNAGLQLTEGGQNVFIGAQAGINNLNNTNTMIGVSTGYQNNGYNNLFMGAGAAAGNAGGYQNTILGNESGENSDGSNNVFLGFRAGYNQTGDNRLVIESSEADSTNALIYGEFDNDLLRINGYLSTYRLAIGNSFSGAETTPENGAIVEGRVGIGTSTPDTSAMLDIASVDKGILIPRTDTTAVNAAGLPATGLLIYQNTNNKFYYFNGAKWRLIGEDAFFEIKDFDGDTKIQVEESPDEDIIRFDIRGNQAMMIDSTGNVGIGTSTPTAKLEVVGDVKVNGKISNVTDPLAAQDAATKNYVDQMAEILLDAGLNGVVMDIDGNVYKTIKIDTQVWMAQNLMTTRYNDGTEIPKVTDNTAWAALTTPAYCWYANDSTLNAKIYGALYNYYTVADTNSLNVCPAGWHVPSDAEWTVLSAFLTANGYGFGGSGVDIGKSLASTFGWTNFGTAGTVGNDQGTNNRCGFAGLPGGSRSSNGPFSTISFSGDWWSSTENGTLSAWLRLLHYNDDDLISSFRIKGFGESVRCLRD